MNQRNVVTVAPNVLDAPPPRNVMEPEVDTYSMVWQDAINAVVDDMSEILLSPPPTPVQDAVLPTVFDEESSDDEDPTNWDQQRLYAAAEEAMRNEQMGADTFFVQVPYPRLPVCCLLPVRANRHTHPSCRSQGDAAAFHPGRGG